MLQSTGGELGSTSFYYLRKETAFRTKQHFGSEEEKSFKAHKDMYVIPLDNFKAAVTFPGTLQLSFITAILGKDTFSLMCCQQVLHSGLCTLKCFFPLNLKCFTTLII